MRMKITLTLALVLALTLALGSAFAGTLLPLAEQQFVDGNGKPYAGGKVYFYIPSTTTPKTTWQDAAGSVPNTNPVVLDSAGRAIIYGTGTYRQILKDSLGNTIWDQLTADTGANGINWGGTSGGTANSQTVTVPNFSSNSGQIIQFIAGFTNTALVSIDPNGTGPIAVKKDTTGGAVFTSGGEIVVGNVITLTYDGVSSVFHLMTLPPTPGQLTNITAAATTNIGSIPSHYVNVLGSTTITSFGSSCVTSQPFYRGKVVNGFTLVYNASSMVLPGARDAIFAAGDTFEAICLGSGNWHVIPGGAFNLPAGIVAFFSAASCPAGWTLADGTGNTVDMRGRYPRGADPSAVHGTTVTVGGYLANQFQDHQHPATVSGGTKGATAATSYSAGGLLGPWQPDDIAVAIGNPNTGSHGAETRPETIGLLACQY